MRLLVLQVVLISALYQATWAFNMWDLTPEEELALEAIVAEAGADNIYYPEAYYNPETRNEDPNTNKPVIPPNTFVAGGAGEGKQHLGPNLIPNKPRIVPEITPPVYDNPPNPCSAQDMENLKTKVASKDKAAIGIQCLCAEDWDKEAVDCAEARKCCIPNMPNEADFVKQFQSVGKEPDDNDIFENMGFNKRNHYYAEGEKRAGHVAKKAPVLKRSSNFVGLDQGYRNNPKVRRNPRNKYFAGPMKKSVVAKKTPRLSGGRLPIM